MALEERGEKKHIHDEVQESQVDDCAVVRESTTHVTWNWIHNFYLKVLWHRPPTHEQLASKLGHGSRIESHLPSLFTTQYGHSAVLKA